MFNKSIASGKKDYFQVKFISEKLNICLAPDVKFSLTIKTRISPDWKPKKKRFNKKIPVHPGIRF